MLPQGMSSGGRGVFCRSFCFNICRFLNAIYTFSANKTSIISIYFIDNQSILTILMTTNYSNGNICLIKIQTIHPDSGPDSRFPSTESRHFVQIHVQIPSPCNGYSSPDQQAQCKLYPLAYQESSIPASVQVHNSPESLN